MAQGLNEVVRDAMMGCHCGCTDMKTVVGEVPWDSPGGMYQNLPDPAGKESRR